MNGSEYHTLIKDLPKEERPRERLQLYGARALSNVELLAIALRTGTQRENAISLAQRVLNQFGNLGRLVHASVQELCQVPGIGIAKAAQIKAALELGRRAVLMTNADRPQVTSPSDAAALFASRLTTDLQEHLLVMSLDTRHRLVRIVDVYKGTVNAANIRMAEVFREAIRDNATAVIIAHNHPSGDLAPSPQDVRFTEDAIRAGKMLDIQVLDHLVISGDAFLSMRERGLGF